MHELIASGDRAAVRYTWSGTVAADLGAGMPPIGARVHVDNALFLRLADGLVIEANEIQSEGIVDYSPL